MKKYKVVVFTLSGHIDFLVHALNGLLALELILERYPQFRELEAVVYET